MKRSLFLASILSVLFCATAPVSFAAAPLKIESGKEVTLYYKLLVEGQVVEVADAKEPFIYKHGDNQIVPGLEKGLVGLKVGDKKNIQVMPADAYGPADPKAIREVPKEKLPPDLPLKPGSFMEARSPQGDILLVKIKEIKDKTVTVDFNHPLAGKDLEFQVEVIQIA